MTIEEQIVQELATTSVGVRVYPLLLPQNPTLPAVTYTRISTTPLYVQGSRAGLGHQRIQFSCWAMTHREVALLAAEVRLALENSTRFIGFEATELDFYEPETRIYHRVVEAILWRQEDV
jgi:hypothetical protein